MYSPQSTKYVSRLLSDFLSSDGISVCEVKRLELLICLCTEKRNSGVIMNYHYWNVSL